MWSYFVKGGPMMWPLLICSIVVIAIIVNKLIFYYKISHDEKLLMQRIKQLLGNNDHTKAIDLCEKYPGPVSAVLKAGLQNKSSGKEGMSKAMEEAGVYEISHLERYLPGLSTIGSISTLMGFTGTVTGMIKAFNSIAAQGVSSPAVIATGIAEALITTATGLIIAIPALVFFHYFSYRMNLFLLEMEIHSKELLKIGE